MSRLASSMFLLSLLVINKSICSEKWLEINVNANLIEGHINPFWESTGFCPPDPHEESYNYFLSKDMKQNLAIISSIPTHDPLQIRIHYLLNLIKMEKINGLMKYNYTYMDELAENFHKLGIKFGFELMGNPSNLFSNFDDVDQVYNWRNLVYNIAQRYTEKFGLNYTSQWNFESWNEPLIGHFEKINMTTTGFLNYYDACSDGLLKTSKKLKLGGPGGECHEPQSKNSFCWAFLNHCNNGTSFFRHKKIRLNYISLHKKGSGSSKEIIKLELKTIKYIRKVYSNLKTTPIFNNEADPMVGWSKNLWWRADATYAAIATKIIDQHIKEYFMKKSPEKDIRFHLLSNDNAFMSYHPYNFNQRTLLARFQINNTTPKQVQFVKKPIFTVMGLWHKLGNHVLQTNISDTDANGNFENIGVIATTHFTNKTGNQIAVLIYSSNDTNNSTGSQHVELNIHFPKNKNKTPYKMISYLVDNKYTNPYRIWKLHGKPAFPNASLLAEMRKHEDPFRFEPQYSFSKNYLHLKFELKSPSVVFIHLAQKAKKPKKIEGLKIFTISKNDILISWLALKENQVILTYEIQYSTVYKGVFQRINNNNTIFASYQHHCDEVGCGNCFIEGYYRVRAWDYWYQIGQYSEILYYGP